MPVTSSNHKMQMTATLISARLLQLLSYHRHGKQPSHNSRVLMGGGTGERRGWLTYLLHSATKPAGCLAVYRTSLTQESGLNVLFQELAICFYVAAKVAVSKCLENSTSLFSNPRSHYLDLLPEKELCLEERLE